MSANSSASSGIGTVGLLGVIFVTLKLCNVIDWNWWWVTLPFWGIIALIIGIVLFVLIIKFFVIMLRRRR